jgi:predicted phage replisome organizer
MAEIKWIKITTDIFSDEKILLIEQMPEADTMLVIWFKLLCMAGRDNNNGIFLMNNKIPYTEEMLATLFRRPLQTVRLAISTFEAFGMIEIVDDVIMLSNWEKHQNIDGMEKIREQNRIRQQRYRERQKQALLEESDVESRYGHAIEEDKEEEKDKEKDKDKNKKNSKPSVYYPMDEALNKAFLDFIEFRKKSKKPMTDRAIELAMKELEKLAGSNNDLAIQIINQSILRGWQSFYPLKGDAQANTTSGAGKSYTDMWRDA